MSSLKQLDKQIEKLAKQRLHVLEKEKGKIRSAVDKILAANSVTLGDLYGPRLKRTAAKFVNPKNPADTWAGRGRKPTWLNEAVAKGASMDELRVQQ